jgi:hypothetical protein
MHYTADMNRMIADRLADALADRVPQRQREQEA